MCGVPSTPQAVTAGGLQSTVYTHTSKGPEPNPEQNSNIFARNSPQNLKNNKRSSVVSRIRHSRERITLKSSVVH